MHCFCTDYIYLYIMEDVPRVVVSWHGQEIFCEPIGPRRMTVNMKSLLLLIRPLRLRPIRCHVKCDHRWQRSRTHTTSERIGNCSPLQHVKNKTLLNSSNDSCKSTTLPVGFCLCQCIHCKRISLSSSIFPTT